METFNKVKVTLGADPELFMIDATGVLRSSIGLIGGTKECPQPLPIGEGYCVQEDNVALEFNIPAADGRDVFVSSIGKTLEFLENHIRGSYGYSLSNLSAASFPKEELNNPNALVFGCDPDFNAWTKQRNPKPASPDPTLRSCGGHIHVGCGKDVEGTQVIQMMDLYLGVPSVIMDKGDLRKQLYGSAGAYREKPYGVEYRTLSNFWVLSNRLIGWVWDNTVRAVNAVESRLVIDEFDKEHIVSAINKNDKNLAWSLVNKYGLEVV